MDKIMFQRQNFNAACLFTFYSIIGIKVLCVCAASDIK